MDNWPIEWREVENQSIEWPRRDWENAARHPAHHESRAGRDGQVAHFGTLRRAVARLVANALSARRHAPGAARRKYAPATTDKMLAAWRGCLKATWRLGILGSEIIGAPPVAFAIAELEYVQGKAGCLCALYPRYLFYNPDKEQNAGNVRILTVSGRETWNPTYKCQCTQCGATFSVEEGEYHSTWWQWRVNAPDR